MAIKQGYFRTKYEHLAWFAPDLPPLTRAIYVTLAYADIFDYPLTLSELHRRLIGLQASRADLSSQLREGDELKDTIIYADNGFFVLAGREAIISTRKQRSAFARELWPTAIQYGQIIARLPFVRMVAVTGALAVDNVETGTDLDYLIVTEPGHLWTCRVLSIALARLAARRGIVLCPNYFISTEALVFPEQNLYTAHELIQMVPLFGQPVYDSIRQANAWSQQFLPNANGPPVRKGFAGLKRNVANRWIEKAFRNGVGQRIERWEMNRKIQKFTELSGAAGESAFSADWCKGHFDQHGRSTMSALEKRLHQLEKAIQ